MVVGNKETVVDVGRTGRFVVDYATAIAGFANTMHNFPIKKILYRTLFRGKGLEFDSYRNFQADDDASMIDWKASLRGNTMLAKKYVEERDLSVYFCVDVSNGMLFGSGDKLKSEFAAEFIVALSHLILESGDKVGLILFNDSIVHIVPPKNSKKHFYNIGKVLGDVENYGGGYSFEAPLDYALEHVKSDYAVFILVSDFIRMHKTIEQRLKMLSNQYEVVAVMVRDAFDEALPETDFSMMVSDPYSNRQVLIDSEMVHEKYKHNVVEHKKRVEEMLKGANIDMLELITDKPFFLPLSQFLRSRSRGGRV
ncbi:MAG: hypothetical protein ACI83O_000834 [Patescibacteria group bacterium]|jgi:uncharacterized protein (DUF58 family)